jgi:hypothetical protein
MRKLEIIGGFVLIIWGNSGCDEKGVGAPGADRGACVGTIAQVTGVAGMPCPPTYEQAMQNPPNSCGSTTTTFPICGGAPVLSINCLLHGFVCVYDPASHALAAMAAFDDVPQSCNFTSSCIAAGTLPSQIVCAADGLRMNCDPLPPTDGGLPDA